MCVCIEPGTILNPDAGPPMAMTGFTLKVTQLGDVGIMPPWSTLRDDSLNVK